MSLHDLHDQESNTFLFLWYILKVHYKSDLYQLYCCYLLFLLLPFSKSCFVWERSYFVCSFFLMLLLQKCDLPLPIVQYQQPPLQDQLVGLLLITTCLLSFVIYPEHNKSSSIKKKKKSHLEKTIRLFPLQYMEVYL